MYIIRKLWQMWTDFNNSFTFGFVDMHYALAYTFMSG